MVNRYTPTVMEGTAHMEPMGAGEWVRWEDYERARADAMKEAADVCKNRWAVHMENSARTYEMDYIDARKDASLLSSCANEADYCADAIRDLIPASPAEPAQVTVQEAAKVLAHLSERRALPFYVVEMPLTASGNGPATIGFDAAKIQYAVWDAADMTTKSRHELLSDAIPAMFRAIAGGRDE
jgi:hypothetical protein